jgi:hypothetical protein
VSENKKGSQTLRVLLLVCAGALLVILYTMGSAVYDVQSARVARATQSLTETCGMPVVLFNKTLPANAQFALRDQCDPKPDAEIR